MPIIVSFSLPDRLPLLLDAEAKRQDRSRSYIAKVAFEEYLARQDPFRTARDRTLQENLALSPIQRVSLAEDLWRGLSEANTAVKRAKRGSGTK